MNQNGFGPVWNGIGLCERSHRAQIMENPGGVYTQYILFFGGINGVFPYLGGEG